MSPSNEPASDVNITPSFSQCVDNLFLGLLMFLTGRLRNSLWKIVSAVHVLCEFQNKI